ncbi:MAG: hypothetical protein ACFB10_26140 [Salibacteraceae bacterium]
MQAKEIRPYYQKHCRFRMRSGKVVYGVIWSDVHQHYFASHREFEAYQSAIQNRDKATCQRLRFPVDLNEVVAAERLN